MSTENPTGETNIARSSVTLVICTMSGTITATADRTQAIDTENRNSATIGTGRYRRGQPRNPVGSSIASRMPSELKRPKSAAQTNFTGTNSIGKTAFLRIARLCLTDAVLVATASLKPRYGMRPANTNSTYSYVPSSLNRMRNTTRYTKQ